MRATVHLAGPLSPTGEAVPFNVLYDGDLDEDEVQAAKIDGRPLRINGVDYRITDVAYQSVVGETLLEIKVAAITS